MSWTTLVFITFYVEIILGLKFCFELVIFLKFQIWKVQILSNDKMTKIKVVDLDELNNFCIHHFYIWNHFGLKIWFELVKF